MFQLATPLALCALPLPLFIYWLSPTDRRPVGTPLPVPFFTAIAPHLRNATAHAHNRSHWLTWFMVIWCLLVVALAGPRWVGPPLPRTHQGHNIFLLLDISGSMALPDMQLHQHIATRLQVVKTAAARFTAARTEDHIGLILFGSEAYLQTPLTYDHDTLRTRIHDATVGLAGKTTAIGDAIGLGIKQFQGTPQKGRIMILLTDGASNAGVLTPKKAATLAQAAHIKLYTIGLSAQPQRASSLSQLLLSMQTTSDLDEPTLRAIANTTGGRYFRATNPQSLQQIYQTIDALETITQHTRPHRPMVEYYPWFIAMALLCLWIWFERTTIRRITCSRFI